MASDDQGQFISNAQSGLTGGLGTNTAGTQINGLRGPCYHVIGITCDNCRPKLVSAACPHCTPRCPHGYPVSPYGTSPLWPYPYPQVLC